jgi:hypothetical protein
MEFLMDSDMESIINVQEITRFFIRKVSDEHYKILANTDELEFDDGFMITSTRNLEDAILFLVKIGKKFGKVHGFPSVTTFPDTSKSNECRQQLFK